MDSEADTESYLLLLLSDGNLPTGSFVASSGLESLFAHALATPHPPTNGPGMTKAHSDPLLAITSSIRDSLSSYARSAIPFVRDTHRVVEDYAATISSDDSDALDRALEGLLELDALYECSTLNHVARRASSTQGVALLTLYSKGFAVPSFLSSSSSSSAPQETNADADADGTKRREARMARLVDRLKFLVRRGDTPGHLPVCWGVLAGALGLSLARTTHLHLFLHARSLLSAAIRMNILGPYASQQILLHVVRPLVESEVKRVGGVRTGVLSRSMRLGDEEGDIWAASLHGPANTWPLGEIVAARHDLLHSRIFNS
ncbi:uncharacterized protein STEHIDRAFT_54777 [Stereum hirsutum FP-91666 SS1]|uniref:uncharacterized protein n=1 Tax=Stereum hirsutum (strain FP-91666) TaxID=721885 RepID=UPI0004409E71|nr:uncharacterized protein STEHIDRAFT_54777 [Stereum hirsutum FP-91666 SS1]EIM87916.1 hypothetical protein STEHIDRAFT_54777 [Stereum hirsutum FP-91666 SS1]